jgi:PAS domain S-box-containing protein
VFITDREGRIEYVNPAFERQTGYTRAEAVNRTPAIVKSGKHDQAFYENLWRTILSGEPFRAVFTNQRKTGELYYDLQTITPLRDEHGVISHFVAASRDITERKRAEQALLNLNKQMEREAERIAQALHDEAGQFLTAAHIALAELVRDLPSSARQRVAEAREHLNQVEEQLRGLSRELRPRILEDLGLPAALEFLAQGVMRRTGIAVAMEVALDERLPRIVETTLYRLAQEALTNASRHAQATRIDVRLAREGRTVRCVVRDNGIGFDVPDVLDRRGDSRLGLVGVRDRLEALGGTLRIDSIPGQGTELHVFVPLEP